ncbi:MAG: phosphatase PAP2 family protein [Tannerella sp.]|jgi:undecaprenyl-diphosphatase|nr:phosphatase PAP2 family protein [Tannerella sp.]
MLENVLDYEQDLFLQLNGAHSLFGNQFMWLYSGKIAWIPVAFLFVVILSCKNRKHWKETLLIFAAIALVITFCDQFSSGFCKPFFSRFRPTHHPDFMNEVKTVFDYRGGRYGFISSHAANAFGFATLTSLIFRYHFYSVVLYIWATMNAYSRIYLGVHFITDIVPGIMAGLFFGWIVYKMYVYIRRKAIPDKAVSADIRCEDTRNLRSGLNLILYILILTIVMMAIISTLYALDVIPALTVK